MDSSLVPIKYEFSVEGMHCVSCVRKIQDVAGNFSNLTDLKVDFSRNQVSTLASEDFDPKGFMEIVQSLGFDIRLLSRGDTQKNSLIRNRHQLSRIGVAGACAGNIMLLSFANYLGAASTEFAKPFDWIGATLFLPIITFCAWPIIKNSAISVFKRRISVDTPIALAVVLGSSLSYYNLLRDTGEVYFDSISMFVFFILGSRYLVMRVQDKHLNPVAVSDVLQTQLIKVIRKGKEQQISSEKVQIGDVVVIGPNKYVPVDGKLLDAASEVDNSIFSGESLPTLLFKWDPVFAGMKTLKEIKIQASKRVDESRIHELVRMLNRSLLERTPLTTLTDKGAHWLTICVVILAIGYFFLAQHFGGVDIINRLLALLVIACPCALAIASPLALSLGIKKALKKSILIKDPSSLEKIKDCDCIIFDKTGTLTDGKIDIISWSPRNPTSEENKILFSIENGSEHPIAKAFLRFVGHQKEIPYNLKREIPGYGVEISTNDYSYRLSRLDSESGQVGFFKDDKLLLKANISDRSNTESKELIQELTRWGKKIFLLSGDTAQASKKIGNDLGLNPSHVYSRKSPEEKMSIVKELMKKHKVLYVGDGINDILAMGEADISISTRSAAQTTFKISSIHLLGSHLRPILDVFKISNKCVSTIQINIVLSSIYNLSFAVMALSGWINPFVAIVLMPLSSLSVTGFTLFKLNQRETA